MIELPNISTEKIAFKLKPSAENLVKKGHPWVFENSILKQNKEGKSGDLAVIFDNRRNKFLAVGFYDPNSPIRIKILHANKAANIDTKWFENKIKEAFDKRLPLLKTETNSYRLIFGENDHLPSLIADVYSEVLVVKLYASFWFPYLKQVLPILIKTSQAKTTVLRLSRNVQKEKNLLNLKDGQVLDGSLKNEVIIFKEHGINFSANVIHGHKTGYFLDHRANRKRVGEISKGKSVLDVFSYAGGFSVHALAGGAKSVTSLDISKPALEIAKSNARLNSFNGIHKTIAGDAFEELEKLATKKTSFDIVVIDPPSFAKSAAEVNKALTSYKKLTNLGLRLVKNGGTLVLASCSSRVTPDEFYALVEETLQRKKHNYTILDKTKHDIDHPIGFKEGAYLKCIYIQIH
ncbi:class I SAM-dependent rRNA methyltransferase [Urechidicola vernalis]|uniref:Class I SAM-dependent rRNA methyltransferase n=1 Tax=Urechidicola vernalis TaxID=3075600 RepID=A0ABU2Y2P5_9FLAO|nr:class I SAM-dependent rRNA methyltransferase [Urechidicola sp. P050]MDT0552471.1 class I SAM-dependent rRNA methyltransferase [Urechidicola sp. P050]